MSSLDWKPSMQYFDQHRQMFMKCIEVEGVKVLLGFDYGKLLGVFTPDGQEITNLVSQDHYSGFEAEIEAEYEHE